MYLALPSVNISHSRHIRTFAAAVPFGRIAFFLYLGKDTIGFIVDAVGALGHFAIALDFLFATHVACLRTQPVRPARNPDDRMGQFTHTLAILLRWPSVTAALAFPSSWPEPDEPGGTTPLLFATAWLLAKGGPSSARCEASPAPPILSGDLRRQG